SDCHLTYLLFFPLLLPPPPTSTLFPYTTLFRSRHLERAPNRGLRDGVDLPAGVERRRRAPLRLRPHGLVEPLRRAGRGGPRADSDRKSTRLNSSHVKISYAVFCLKKKK